MPDLTNLAAVRRYLQSVGNDQDQVIGDLITAASGVIQEWTGREFTPSGPSTRRFPVTGRIVDLEPFDLRSASAVTLDPESTSPRVLTVDVDYALEPVSKALGGTYVQVRLSSFVPFGLSQAAQAFGRAYLDVTGLWGMSDVPAAVAQACVDTVCAWMRSDVQSFSTSFNPDEPGVVYSSGANLPASVRYKIHPYRRLTFA